MKNRKQKHWATLLGGMAALAGMFLPYVDGISFFQSLSGPEYGFFAPVFTLGITLAAILYALDLKLIPYIISMVVLVICIAFPGYACWKVGAGAILSHLQVGAWVLLGGLLLMAFQPLC